MKTDQSYIKLFENEDLAYYHMVSRNRTNRIKGLIYCLTIGPEDNYAVVDLVTAIELGQSYSWSLI